MSLTHEQPRINDTSKFDIKIPSMSECLAFCLAFCLSILFVAFNATIDFERVNLSVSMSHFITTKACKDKSRISDQGRSAARKVTYILLPK